MHLISLAVILSLTRLIVATSRGRDQIQRTRVIGFNGNQSKTLACPLPFPVGIPRVSGSPPNYYPFADRAEVLIALALLECPGSGRHLQQFLRHGCPRFWTLVNNGTTGLLSYIIHGLGSWYLKDCVGTSQIRFESLCTHPNRDPKFNYRISQTIKTPTLTVAVRCYNNGVYSWIASSTAPVLSPIDLNTLKQHVTSLGFDWDNAEKIQYDACHSCS